MDQTLNIDFITNTRSDNHLRLITEQMGASKEVWIAVAFLKQSGLKLLEAPVKEAIARGTRFKVICGLDLYITEPEAIHTLQDWFHGQDENVLRLMPVNNRKTFHSKVYCFHKRNEEVTLLVGSANLTRGGIQKNFEASMLINTARESHVFAQVQAFFDDCSRKAKTVTALVLSKYTSEFDKHKKKKREAEREIESVPLHIQKLDAYKEEYLADENEQRDFAHRSENYIEAKQVLMAMITEPISSREAFMQYYEQLVGKAGDKKLWHSGLVHIGKNDVANDYPLFIEMVRDIQINLHLSPADMFRLGKPHTKKINQVNANILTEVMHTFDPDRFPVLNNNPRKGLIHFGLERFPDPKLFKPETYKRYTDLMKEFRSACDFEDLGRVDHFFNFLYWKYVKE